MLRIVGFIGMGVCTILTTGCMSCADYLRNPRTLLDDSQQVYCSHHRVPILTVTAFTEPRFAHVDGFQRNDMTREAYRKYEGTVFACNPNCLQPYFSLQRHGRFTTPTSTTYCPKCEEAVAPYRDASNQAMQRTAGRSAF